MNTKTEVRIVHSEMAQQVALLGAMYGYTYEILPHRGEISETVAKLGWTYTPIEQDNTEIPPSALERLEPLYENYVPIEQILIGHEIVISRPVRETAPVDRPRTDTDSGKKVATIAGIIGMVVMGLIFAIGQILFFALAADPEIVIVLGDEDRTWISVATWLE